MGSPFSIVGHCNSIRPTLARQHNISYCAEWYLVSRAGSVLVVHGTLLLSGILGTICLWLWVCSNTPLLSLSLAIVIRLPWACSTTPLLRLSLAIVIRLPWACITSHPSTHAM